MKLIDYPKSKTLEGGFESRTFSDSFEFLLTAGVKNAGILLADINERVYEYLRSYNIPVTFEERLSARALKFKELQPLPLSLKVTNFSDSRISSLTGIAKNVQLPQPVIELYSGIKPGQVINETHLIASGLVTGSSLIQISKLTSKTNMLLKAFFERRNLLLGSIVLTFSESMGEVFISGNFLPNNLRIGEGGPEKNDVSILKSELTPKHFLTLLSKL